MEADQNLGASCCCSSAKVIVSDFANATCCVLTHQHWPWDLPGLALAEVHFISFPAVTAIVCLSGDCYLPCLSLSLCILNVVKV